MFRIGDRAPGSATHRGSQNSDQSGVQPEFPPSFSNQMVRQQFQYKFAGNFRECNLSSAKINVCVSLPAKLSMCNTCACMGVYPSFNFCVTEKRKILHLMKMFSHNYTVM